MNLHKILFPSKDKELAFYKKDLNYEVKSLQDQLLIYQRKSMRLEEQIESLPKNTPSEMENIMRASLGLPYIRFDNIEKDSKGNDNPPHYLKGLDQQARLTYLADMSQIFKNPHFIEVMNYHINVLGNHSIQKAADEDMRNGRIGIIALRGFRKEFEDADAEYMDSKQPEEEFDKHGILPG